MTKIQAYQMTAKNQPFERTSYPAPALLSGEVLIKIAGCGVCHTDISFWHYGVPTRKEPPLTLGHEISGTVLEGPAELVGKSVVVPAVLPCGDCELCRNDRSNICQKQKMPGNDFNGGFASHVIVPSRFVSIVSESILARFDLAELAVIADAVSTPYQVIQKSGLKAGDFAVVIGVGGVGLYAAQLAQIAGAKVLALDLSQERLDLLVQAGVTSTLNTKCMSVKEIKDGVKAACKAMGAPPHGWKIYEVSGSTAGQELGFALLGIAGVLSIVGFTLDKLELRLSNLMAFDAQVIGTWGCKPELYADVIGMVGNGSLKLSPFTQTYPLSQINDVFEQALNHKLLKRAVLVPDFQN